MRKRWIVACVVGLCALPAAASAADFHWQYIADPAPGGTGLDGTFETPPRVNLTVANGTPYLAVRSIAGGYALRVYRAVGTRAWREIGSEPEGFGPVDLTSAGSAAWIAWSASSSGVPEVHVARLSSSGMRELRGSPIRGGTSAQIAYYAGRLYVAYSGADGMHAVRTRANGRGFERIESFDHTPATPGEMGVYRDRLYLSDFESGTTLYSLLNRRRTGWVQVDEPPANLFDPRVGNTLFTHSFSGAEFPEAPIFVHVFRTQGGVTEEMPNPATPGTDVSPAYGVDLVASAGTVWIAFVEGGCCAMSEPRIPHVAKLVPGAG